MKRKLTLRLHQPSQMAELREGKSHTLHMGNFWDFHAGCHGTKVLFADGTEVDFADVWTEDIRRPIPMAEMVADRIGADLVIRNRKTPII